MFPRHPVVTQEAVTQEAVTQEEATQEEVILEEATQYVLAYECFIIP